MPHPASPAAPPLRAGQPQIEGIFGVVADSAQEQRFRDQFDLAAGSVLEDADALCLVWLMEACFSCWTRCRKRRQSACQFL